jgi:hypothetical protein
LQSAVIGGVVFWLSSSIMSAPMAMILTIAVSFAVRYMTRHKLLEAVGNIWSEKIVGICENAKLNLRMLTAGTVAALFMGLWVSLV